MTLYGKAKRRAPTAFFNIAGINPRVVATHLAARGVNVWNGDNYAYEFCAASASSPTARSGPAWCTTTTPPT